MTEYQDAIELLKRIEQNQLKSLDLQAEQLAVVKAQMARTEANVQESIGLQKRAMSKQGQALNVLLPVIFAVLIYLGYLLFKRT